MEEKKHKLKILWNSNALWASSGYSNQTRQIVPLIHDEGYEIACSNFYGQEGGIFILDGIPQFPKIGDPWGGDAMVEHSRRWGADVVISLQDIWTVDINAYKALAANKVRLIPYCPIDHDPVPPAIFERLKHAYRIISFCEYGHRKLEEKGMHSTCIPHMVNTDHFKKSDRSLRDKYNIPQDMFLFGMVAANKDNPPRKAFDYVLNAFKIFLQNHPNKKIGIYFHSMPRQQNGFPIDEYASTIGIPKTSIFFPEAYDILYGTPQEKMYQVYNMFDVLLMPSLNEGFGIPAIEAQACEVPVITHDTTSMTELVIPGKTGWLVKSLEKRYTQLSSFISVPDFMDIREKMEIVYTSDLAQIGKDAREFMLQKYSHKVVWENGWKPFLQVLEREIFDLKI
jgi:glycosyltransferase involved in cell wall biosynthesis